MHGIGQKEPTDGNELSSVDQVCRCRSIKMIRPRPITSDQIKPNPTKKNGPARIEARADGSRLGRTNLEFGRARWLRGKAERMNGNANCLRACFKISRGLVFGQKAGGRGATREALRAATTEQLRRHSRAGRRQTAFSTGLHQALHPLPARNERGEDRGEGKPIETPLLSPALSSIRWRRGRNPGA